MRLDKNVLRDIIGDDARVVFEHMDPKFLSDTLGRLKGSADALVFPSSTREVSGILKYAYENRIPVTPRGAGTNLVGSTVPVDGGIILDLSQMNRILELDRDTFTATAEPGVLLQDFQAYVEKEGFFYPPDPGEKASTLGGNISTNAGGMRAVKYGVTRDYVRGLEIVLADGTVLTAGSKNVKDASGLSVKNLIVGSEGTLAVITKCIMKLIPRPETSVSVLVPFGDLKVGIENVLSILHANVNPTAVEFVERKVISLGEEFMDFTYPRPDAGSYIILTFDGRKAEVDASVEQVRQLVMGKGALDYLVLTDPETAAGIWKVRGALVKAVEAVSEQEPVDIVVPIDRSHDFIHYINRLEQETKMQMVSFGHAGDGNVHLCVVRGSRDEETWHRELKGNMERIYKKAYELGGLTSGEHGIGISKRPYFLHETAGENLLVMNRIKDALDPRHILNNRKSYITGGETDAKII
ncbi:FAD-binding oxidoreductase [Lachnospiraceae bacterium 54-53]